MPPETSQAPHTPLRHTGKSRTSDARPAASVREVDHRLAVLETWFQNVPLGLAFVDRECRFVRINGRLATSLYASPADHLGKTVREVVPLLWPVLEPLYGRALAGETVTNQTIHDLTLQGEPRSWLASYHPVSLEGRIVGVDVVVSDGTAHRQPQEILPAAGDAIQAVPSATQERVWDGANAAADLGAIIQSSDDAIIGLTLNGTVTSWNRGAEALYGFSADEMVGTSIERLSPAGWPADEGDALTRIQRGEVVQQFETVQQTKDGRSLDVSVTASPIKDGLGRLVGVSKIARDITAIKTKEREIIRLSRLYAALSQINQTIVRASTRDELLRGVCKALVEDGGVSMAWIGWRDPETSRIEPVAKWGDTRGALESPTGSAIAGDPLDPPAISTSTKQIDPRGFRAVAVLAIRIRGAVCGTLNVYASDAGPFQEKEEIALLEQAAVDISSAVDNLTQEEARGRAQHNIQRERDFSDAVLTSLPGIVYLYDPDGKFLRWNYNFEKVTGYPAAELATMHPADFFAIAETERIASWITDVFQKGKAEVEADLLSKDGRLTPYYLTGVMIEIDGLTCLVGVGIDIATPKRAEEAQRASEARYRSLFEQAPDGIVITDPQSRYVDANGGMCRLLGYARHELLGLRGSDIVPQTDVREVPTVLGTIDERAEQRQECRLRRKDGSLFVADVIATRLPDGNTLALIRDVTDRKAAETGLRELNETLELKVAMRTAEVETALARAEAADQIKSAFLATMSHELRTPLNSIIGFTGIVLNGMAGPLNPEQAKQLAMVRSSAQHLLELINDILDLSKIEAGQLEVRNESFDLRDSLERVAALVRPLAARKGLTLSTVAMPERLGMTSDRRRVEQILINLLGNAIKFTVEGGVTLSADLVAATAQSAGTPPGPAVRIRVADTGLGIGPSDLTTLFQPFRQLDMGLARQHEGTGLGLAICRKLATLLGGEISATSDPAKGSEFTVMIPLNRTTPTP